MDELLDRLDKNKKKAFEPENGLALIAEKIRRIVNDISGHHTSKIFNETSMA